ncbi:hypothetical protein KBZ14_14675 [Synechococcus sp. HJ21-Hayes]|jgi:hypothetical protein|uniref:hypothetical protein n=1 Tax=Synechococcus sp. HJ21-Hayes TaxID=2823736 RepID=UPI0020CC9810|nr:hypothetical protein [Synechococcus sp. HJ21-Hayes]MCP9854101.1 hypothetical protein [Synechococcus sp. HJ21-Hayes]
MSNCGEPPKLVAFGIAPLGIISIGIVPMGVVSIGVVPMGVLSLGVVGMGVVNACVVGMGVVVAGLNAMGIWSLSPPGNGHQHHSSGAPQEQLMAYPSKQVALEKARALGCDGVHAMGNLWMPCSEHPSQTSTHQH